MREPSTIKIAGVKVSRTASGRAILRKVARHKRNNRVFPTRSERARIIQEAQSLKGTYDLNNVLVGKYTISGRDIHNLAYEMSDELKPNMEKIIMGIRDVIEKGRYVGWSKTDPNTHNGTAYFAYFSKNLGRKVYVGMKYIERQGVYKPYVIYSRNEFNEKRRPKLEKGTPIV